MSLRPVRLFVMDRHRCVKLASTIFLPFVLTKSVASTVLLLLLRLLPPSCVYLCVPYLCSFASLAPFVHVCGLRRFTKLALALAIAALVLAVAVDAKKKDDKETTTRTVSHTTAKLTAAPRTVSKEAPPGKGPPKAVRAPPQVLRDRERGTRLGKKRDLTHQTARAHRHTRAL